MSETWHWCRGETIWSLHRRCDEARLHFCLWQKLLFGSVKPSPPTVHRTAELIFEPVTREIKRKSRCRSICFSFYGAGDEARTRYLHLGKVALYRMSYTRGTRDIIANVFRMSISIFKNSPNSLVLILLKL